MSAGLAPVRYSGHGEFQLGSEEAHSPHRAPATRLGTDRTTYVYARTAIDDGLHASMATISVGLSPCRCGPGASMGVLLSTTAAAAPPTGGTQHSQAAPWRTELFLSPGPHDRQGASSL